MAEYLRLPDLHADDDFFASGGHSLLGAQLLQALGREYGLKIPLATLFEAPTAHQLADWLQSALATRTPAAGTRPRHGLRRRRQQPCRHRPCRRGCHQCLPGRYRAFRWTSPGSRTGVPRRGASP